MNCWRRIQLVVGLITIALTALMMIKLSKLNNDFVIAIDNPTLVSTTNNIAPSNNNIRRWGCDRKETPFIFIHIGKAGGGEIRRKIAAAAIDYNRGGDWRNSGKDDHYYPIIAEGDDANGIIRHGKFCNSGYQNFYIPNKGGNTVSKSFEGSKPCNATTPLGHAIGCPAQYQQKRCQGCNMNGVVNSTICDVIYVGHNMLGNEMHWLPPKYLSRWWHQYWYSRNDNSSSSYNISQDHHYFDSIYQGFHSIMPNQQYPQWCTKNNISRPYQIYSRNTNYTIDRENPVLMECSRIAALKADEEIEEYWKLLGNKPNNYSPLYASLPLHRVVMLREPISWLKSKFYWHKEYRNCACDDIKCARNWADSRARLYIYYLCGEDCLSRYQTKTITLEEMTNQAEDNLRNSFSVVGLLNETESFYDMIEMRLSYMNMSQSLPAELSGGRHASGKGKNITEYNRCSDVFESETFRQRLREEYPSVAAAERLYYLGVEINRFQNEELQHCMRKRRV